MIALLDAAQIKRVLVLVGDDVAEAIDVERARARDVGDAKLGVAPAHDVERRIEDGIAEGHGASGASNAVSSWTARRADPGSIYHGTCSVCCDMGPGSRAARSAGMTSGECARHRITPQSSGSCDCRARSRCSSFPYGSRTK